MSGRENGYGCRRAGELFPNPERRQSICLGTGSDRFGDDNSAVAYQVIATRRLKAASKATQENFETIAADLRKRALEVKKQDEGLRKRDLEAKERDELKGFVEDANAELAEQPQRSQQQQVLKGSQRALKESVSQIIVVGLEDIQNRMLQTDFTGMTSVVFDNSKAGLQRKPEVASARWLAQDRCASCIDHRFIHVEIKHRRRGFQEIFEIGGIAFAWQFAGEKGGSF